MAPFAIPLLKPSFATRPRPKLRELLTEVLKLGGPQEIRQRVEQRMRERFPVG
jgi:hypothetical protein